MAARTGGGTRRGSAARYVLEDGEEHPPGYLARLRRWRSWIATVALLLLATPAIAEAQLLTRPALQWRTLPTEHFVFHYPAGMEDWTRDVASRMEAVRAEVGALVGYTPGKRVTVLVEDPSGISNGFALPFRGSPTLFLWPTPPEPSGSLTDHRGWGELLAVHEFTHLAHLDRPSRNQLQSLLWRILPVNLGPVARRSPRWVIEGYATYIEGLLTGGRPAGVARAAVLRQWGVEGQLPTYEQLNGSGRFMGGNMAYLAGSAFLEWLVEREGPESLPNLWRRMTARTDRGFDAAFEGVFGAPAPELYGRFTSRLTAHAIAIEDSLRSRPPVGDSLLQRLGWGTGGPALSPDGSLTAVVLRSANRPSRVVVWSTVDTTDTLAAVRARERLLEEDPEDVPAVRRRPPPRKPLHTLLPIAERGFHSPRFMPDGRDLLVVRSVPQGDGSERSVLFRWTPDDGTISRITHGDGSVRDPDPAPDGETAAAVRCANGICDLVLVDLATGEWRVLAPGSPRRTFSRPRWSPDGNQLLVSVHEGGRWMPMLVPANGGELRAVDPDGATRYDADFVDARTIVATSEVGGIAHLELIPLDGGAPRTLTGTTGEHVRAEASPDGRKVYFLALHARGYDLREVSVLSAVDGTPTPFAQDLWPAIPPAAIGRDTFPTEPLPAARSYGLGPRNHRILPGIAIGAEGRSAQLALYGTDPIGRLSWLLRGSAGDAATWRGGSLDAEFRGLPPVIRAAIFDARREPSRGRESAIIAGAPMDNRYRGVSLSTSLAREYGNVAYRVSGGWSAGAISRLTQTAPDGRRDLAFAEVAGAVRWDGDRRHLAPSVSIRGATGRTSDSTWNRATMSLGLNAALGMLNLNGTLRYALTNTGAPAYERLHVGGLPSPLANGALLDQQWTAPALPWGIATGTRAASYRVETELMGVRPFLAGYATGGVVPDADGMRTNEANHLDVHDWRRLVGLEYTTTIPPVAFVATPAVRITAGVARSLDAPFERTRGYLTITYSP